MGCSMLLEIVSRDFAAADRGLLIDVLYMSLDLTPPLCEVVAHCEACQRQALMWYLEYRPLGVLAGHIGALRNCHKECMLSMKASR